MNIGDSGGDDTPQVDSNKTDDRAEIITHILTLPPSPMGSCSEDMQVYFYNYINILFLSNALEVFLIEKQLEWK